MPLNMIDLYKTPPSPSPTPSSTPTPSAIYSKMQFVLFYLQFRPGRLLSERFLIHVIKLPPEFLGCLWAFEF